MTQEMDKVDVFDKVSKGFGRKPMQSKIGNVQGRSYSAFSINYETLLSNTFCKRVSMRYIKRLRIDARGTGYLARGKVAGVLATSQGEKESTG